MMFGFELLWPMSSIFQAANVTSTTKGDGASRLVEVLKDDSYLIAMKSCS